MFCIFNLVQIFFIVYCCFKFNISYCFRAVADLIQPKSILAILTDFGQLGFAFPKNSVMLFRSNFSKNLQKLGLRLFPLSKLKAVKTVEDGLCLMLFVYPTTLLITFSRRGRAPTSPLVIILLVRILHPRILFKNWVWTRSILLSSQVV